MSEVDIVEEKVVVSIGALDDEPQVHQGDLRGIYARLHDLTGRVQGEGLPLVAFHCDDGLDRARHRCGSDGRELVIISGDAVGERVEGVLARIKDLHLYTERPLPAVTGVRLGEGVVECESQVIEQARCHPKPLAVHDGGRAGAAHPRAQEGVAVERWDFARTDSELLARSELLDLGTITMGAPLLVEGALELDLPSGGTVLEGRIGDVVEGTRQVSAAGRYAHLVHGCLGAVWRDAHPLSGQVGAFGRGADLLLLDAVRREAGRVLAGPGRDQALPVDA